MNKSSATKLVGILVTAIAACSLLGCTVEDGVGTNAEQYATESTQDLQKELTDKYGVRPRQYGGLFNGSNEAEARFVAHLPVVSAELSRIAADNGYGFSVTEPELATNFITEGGYFLLELNIADSDFTTGRYIDGYAYLGVDTFWDNIEALEPWLTSGLRDAYHAGELYEREEVNELGQSVTTVVVTTIEQGLEANAVVFAWTRAVLANDLLSLSRLPPEQLDFEPRFFWTTVYFNAGPGFGLKRMKAEGVDYWQQKWTDEDNADKYGHVARFNGLWRTASFEYMDRTTFAAD